MSGYCQEYEDRGKPCGVEVACPLCSSCLYHCLCLDDQYECKHGVEWKADCADCTAAREPA